VKEIFKFFHTIHINQIAGTIPTTLGGLLLTAGETSTRNSHSQGFLLVLRHLCLDSNQLTSTIPPELGQLPLESLFLSRNQLQGSIPPELFDNKRLVDVRLDHNTQLGGTIPDAIGNADRNTLRYKTSPQ
jgi:hypothetical protein